MNTASQSGKSAALALNPHQQNLESVHRIVDQILHLAGCGQCGRLAFLNVSFISDPSPELAKAGVISAETRGF